MAARKEPNRNDINRPEARLPRGFSGVGGDDLRALNRMIGTIREVYERYGFEPLETPAIEYTDALGKFLPDLDRPNEGVFSFQDEDEQWLSLRYDLTAPLARYVAEGLKEQKLALPFRRYAVGPVWRNEKPGPGRFRQFTQFDADTVGTDNIAADAEICMLAADTLEALGIKRGDYVVKVNNRKVLDGLRETIGLNDTAHDARWLTIMRALDKYDRLGEAGVQALLGAGRKDESGDYTKGAELDRASIVTVMSIFEPVADAEEKIAQLDVRLRDSAIGQQGRAELEAIWKLATAAGFGADRIRIDPSVVRGLEYYTGPVFEAEITIPVVNEDGQTVRFGSVGGGGRYDGLVERFLGQKVPATGFSIGVSRLQAALAAINKDKPAVHNGPVVVLVMDKAEMPRFQAMAQELRGAGIRAEVYLGTSGMKAQMKYADRRHAPCVVIEGSDERAKGEVQIKDLIEGAKAAAAIKDNATWKAQRPAQVSVARASLVETVREVVGRHGG